MALPSPAAAAPPAIPADAVDATDAALTAKRTGHDVEVPAARTESSQIFATARGTFVMQRSLQPKRVKRSNGTWANIDPTLRLLPDGSIAPVASTADVRFSNGGSGTLVSLSATGRSMALTWPLKLPKPVLLGDTATYVDVLPGIDLVLRAEVDGFSNLVVVKTPSAAENPALRKLTYGVKTTGVSLESDPATGAVSALDPAGARVFGAATPMMWESAPTSGSDAQARAMTQSSTPGTTPAAIEPRQAAVGTAVVGGSLVLSPDVRLLTDPSAVFPLVIDPTWRYSSPGRSHWTLLRKSSPSSSFWDITSLGSNDANSGVVRAGYSNYGGNYTDRSLFEMNLNDVRFTHVNRATFRLTQRWSSSYCGDPTDRWTYLYLTNGINSGTTWNTSWNSNNSGWAQQLGSSKALKFYNSGSCPAGPVEFDVTSKIQQASAEGWTAITLGLRAKSETDNLSWKRYDLNSVTLSIEYNSYPNAPATLDTSTDGRPCVTGAARPVVATKTPVLSARLSDPDPGQQALSGTFYWWPVGGSRNETDKVSYDGVTNPGVALAHVPAGRLAEGGSYAWQAFTSDGIDGSQGSPTCEFTVDADPPPPPSSVTSTDYPADGSFHGGVGRAGTFVFHPPASGAADVAAYVYTLTPLTDPTSGTVVTAAADHSASAVVTPATDTPNPNTLKVWTRDRAGHLSTTAVSYQFLVRPGSGPAAQWSFDEEGGTADDVTWHENTATLAGSATRTPGRSQVGTALSLNGSTGYAATTGPLVSPDANTGVPAQVRSDQSFSVAAWVNLTTTGGSVPLRAAVSQDGSRTSAYVLGYDATANKWCFQMAGSDVDSPAVAKVSANGTASAGVWTHIAGTYDVTTHTLRLYVNGVAQTATATLSGGFNAAGPVTTGRLRAAGAAGGHWSGSLDDVAVYDRVTFAADLQPLAKPLPPALSVPADTTFVVNQPVQVTIGGGGDANVRSYRYSLGDLSLSGVATPSVYGGTVTVAVTPQDVDSYVFYAVAVDAAGATSEIGVVSFETIPAPALSGRLTYAGSGTTAAGVIVTVNPGGVTATTGPDGRYQIDGLPTGTFTVSAVAGTRCGQSASTQVDLQSATTVDLVLASTPDAFGYICTVTARAFEPADQTVLALTGDDNSQIVTSPFPVSFYGQTFTQLWVSTNGFVSFQDPGGWSRRRTVRRSPTLPRRTHWSPRTGRTYT